MVVSAIASTPHIGYVIKTENKETPFTVVDIDGLSGNFKTLVEGATKMGNDSNLLIVFYVQIMPDDLVMQLHRF
ncbi:hypothetical protein C5K08_27450 [Shigella flexneri]|nr:hypothetical protein C5K08_27450 [Shigella flexneri]